MKTKKMKIEAVRHKSKQDYQLHRLLRNHYADTHGPLLEALRNSSLQIEHLHEKFGETGSGNSVLSGNRQAIEDAETVEVPG